MEPVEWRWGSDVTMELVKEIGGSQDRAGRRHSHFLEEVQ